MEVFEHSEGDKEILHILAEGEREINAGDGYDLETVLAEADALLGRKRFVERHLRTPPK
jgi:hypothetical protein